MKPIQKNKFLSYEWITAFITVIFAITIIIDFQSRKNINLIIYIIIGIVFVLFFITTIVIHNSKNK